jgi:hypothetical protein
LHHSTNAYYPVPTTARYAVIICPIILNREYISPTSKNISISNEFSKANDVNLQQSMEFSLENEVCLVDSLFYLALSNIPVKSKYGENYVLYNHKTGQIAPVDLKGSTTVEPGGVYTSEKIDSPIIQLKPTSPVI